MTVMAREAWTDERLDDLNAKVDKGFDRVDKNFERVDTEFHHLRSEMNSRFNAVEARLDRLQQTMIIGFASIVAAVVGAGIIG
jgi:uncharacterized protein YPO0396